MRYYTAIWQPQEPGRSPKTVTKPLKNTSINASFKTNNRTGKLLQPKPTTHDTKQHTYQLQCYDCAQKYTEQLGRL